MVNIDLMVLAGDYVKTAVISEWKVKVGDSVKKGDVLLVVETNKITQDIEASCDGIVEQILFQEGDDVEISKTVAVIVDGSGTAAAPEEEKPAIEISGSETASLDTGVRTVITPVAKKMAKEKGIDLDELTKRFPGKRIGKKEVLAFEEAPAKDFFVTGQHGKEGGETADPADRPSTATAMDCSLLSSSENSEEAEAAVSVAKTTEIPVKGIRKAIASAMRNSAYSKPHVSMMIDVQLDEMLEMKAFLKNKYPEKRITLTGLLALAVRSALGECPYINGTATEDTITLSDSVNLGIAVDAEGGLLVPVIKNIGAKSGLELFEAVNHAAKGCREGTLAPSDYAGGTFTISNVGATGVKYFTPIINSPEIAILGVGASTKEAVVVNGEVRERTMIGLSLSFDHAVVDGSPAGRFLKTLKEKIEHPFMMALS